MRDPQEKFPGDDAGATMAAAVAEARYQVRARAARLAGFADQTFRLTLDDGTSRILKIGAPGHDAGEGFQDAMLNFLAGEKLPFRVPRPLPDLDGRTLAGWTDPEGGSRTVRLFDDLPGTFACDLVPLDGHTLRRIGRGLAALDKALLAFRHAGSQRSHEWDITRAPEICAGAPVAEDLAPRVTRALEDFRARVRGDIAGLRHSVIHGDVNDHNLLLEAGTGRGFGMAGLIDFGDAAHAPLVAELAVAMAYLMMRQPTPLRAAEDLVAGYHAVLPLKESEIGLLYDLVRTRLAMSLSHSARGRLAEPGNRYLTRSEKDAAALLAALDDIHRRFFTASLRHICGLPASPRGAALTRWLAGRTFPPVVDGLSSSDVRIVDLTPRSADLDGQVAPAGLEEFEQQIAKVTAQSGLALGRWSEIRGLYQSPVFRAGDSEPRTVHLGADIFAPAGTWVRAPLDGEVFSIAVNDRPLDYGPTVILRHTGPELPFFTLYGHLSKASVAGLEPGQKLAGGEAFVCIGDARENGGWPPHLHFQLIADLLGQRGDFPGVARHSEIGVWQSLCPNPAAFVAADAEELDGHCGADPVALEQRRDLCVGPSLSLSFDRPVKIVRARGASLYTEQGREILDLVNNVAHVGHAHPQVVAAIARQEARLNTNTRYLHDGLVTYAERLTALAPAPLDTCFLVCTGSEANDLAMRLARAHTGGSGVVVVDGAYHGSLAALVEISPYKFSGPGGAGRPAHVQVADMPDCYNGRHASQPDAARRYADSVAAALDRVFEDGRDPAMFICESALGCGGQVILPAGYLSAAYAEARARGAVCVADEVQVGFGRLGSHMWGFEHQDVVPDILTLGKPIGNGYPMAAVLTTRDIAESFANGMEYFNTFGGNPVACAAGHAVLDVMAREQLVERAATLGRIWLEMLRELAGRHEQIGDVRGLGLFIGIELVEDSTTRRPAAAAARRVVEAMISRDVQVSIDGPRYNVIKIKPPMVISLAEIERATAALDEALAAVRQAPSARR